MVSPTKPDHLKRLGIIFVMSVGFFRPANNAWLAHEPTRSDRHRNGKAGCRFGWISFSIFLRALEKQRWVGSVSIVRPRLRAIA
jgi:hypothetical protein